MRESRQGKRGNSIVVHGPRTDSAADSFVGADRIATLGHKILCDLNEKIPWEQVGVVYTEPALSQFP